MSSKRDPGKWLHLGAGFLTICLFLGGYLREVQQHDWSLSLHQWIEALAWGIGGLIGWFFGVPLFKRFLK